MEAERRVRRWSPASALMQAASISRQCRFPRWAGCSQQPERPGARTRSAPTPSSLAADKPGGDILPPAACRDYGGTGAGASGIEACSFYATELNARQRAGGEQRSGTIRPAPLSAGRVTGGTGTGGYWFVDHPLNYGLFVQHVIRAQQRRK